jgi:ABC-type sulfate/molybdate transport systems ATPase subunit
LPARLAREPRVLLLDEPFGALDALTRQQVRAELADILADVRLPTLLVTHAFDDASALGERIGVLDQGRLVQLATAADLMREPATVMVAALTGANVVQGSAVPASRGSTIRLAGGGELFSDASVEGQVEVAVHPWSLELTSPSESTLTDSVVSVREERGGLVIRLTRFVVHVPLSASGRRAVEPGATVGLRADPRNVRVLKPEAQRR